MEHESGFNFAQLGLEVGGGAVLGFITGYAAKKVVKVVAVIIGLQLALFKFLETRGVMEVHWTRLYNSTANVTSAGAEQATEEGGGLLNSFLAMLPVGGGFAAGAAVGFKKG